MIVFGYFLATLSKHLPINQMVNKVSQWSIPAVLIISSSALFLYGRTFVRCVPCYIMILIFSCTLIIYEEPINKVVIPKSPIIIKEGIMMTVRFALFIVTVVYLPILLSSFSRMLVASQIS